SPARAVTVTSPLACRTAFATTSDVRSASVCSCVDAMPAARAHRTTWWRAARMAPVVGRRWRLRLPSEEAAGAAMGSRPLLVRFTMVRPPRPRATAGRRGPSADRRAVAQDVGHALLERRDDVEETLGRDRSGEAEALRHLAPHAVQREQRLVVLDALGDARQAEARAELDDGAHDRRARRVVADAPHERPVDLEPADRQVLQVRERAVARAVVVDRDRGAE